MDYDFGDILDARNATSIGHFILVVGQITRKDKITKLEVTEVMYYIITSRVYAVFKNILVYFNDCLSRGDKNFLKHYGKEKAKTTIRIAMVCCHCGNDRMHLQLLMIQCGYGTRSLWYDKMLWHLLVKR